VPQLDEGCFESLTITSQLRVIDAAVGGESVTLMGSSLGGYLAALYAARHANVENLILMAPALDFPSRWRERFSTAELDEWKRAGAKLFYHYGYKADRALGYRFLEDAFQYEDRPEFTQPALLLHGRNDDVVPAGVSEQFAAAHPSATLRVLESGHELTDVMDTLWNETRMFLEFQKQ
jgi:pimeloyl-ACP methyl ester carboxylesterase